MKKEQLILLLKQYKENNAKLKLRLREKEALLRKLEHLKEVDVSSSTIELNGDIHSKNKIGDRTGNNAIDNLETEAEKREKLKDTEEEISELTIMIEEVDIRLGALKYREKENVFSRLVLYRLSRKYGLEISPKAEIGEGMYLGHPYNITIGEGVIIGNNVNLHKGCTIGKTNRGNMGSPTIGNCVFIGVNATVVGNIHIGNDVLIAPNSYINFNVPDHSIVIGNPGIIHYRKNATEGYISFRVKTYGENDEENIISYS